MNIIELHLTINPSSYFKEDIADLKIYKQEIIKETDKQIKVKNFGHMYSTIINKEMLDKIQHEESLEIRVNSIKRWIYIKEDESYNEESLKSLLTNDILDEIKERKYILEQMEKLVEDIKIRRIDK